MDRNKQLFKKQGNGIPPISMKVQREASTASL